MVESNLRTKKMKGLKTIIKGTTNTIDETINALFSLLYLGEISGRNKYILKNIRYFREINV